MITEQQLFDIGFRRFGDEENDPYYKVIFSNRIFDVFQLSGNFLSYLQGNESIEGFVLFDMGFDRVFTSIDEIKQIIEINGFIINHDLTNKYGSSELIK